MFRDGFIGDQCLWLLALPMFLLHPLSATGCVQAKSCWISYVLINVVKLKQIRTRTFITFGFYLNSVDFQMNLTLWKPVVIIIHLAHFGVNSRQIKAACCMLATEQQKSDAST